MRSELLAALTALVALASIAGTVAAATPPTSDYGNDVECRYKADGPGPAYDWRLKKFVVTPPVLYAKKGTQTVGWRFIVKRALNWGNDPWKVTYRSPAQKRTATTTQAASFNSKSVDVTIPNVENVTSVWYRVTLKLAWYKADGSIHSQTSYVMPWMKGILNGHYYNDYDDVCQAGFYEGP